MKRIFRILLFVLVLLVFQSFGVKRIDYERGRHNNVCKELKDNVLIYFIFIDSKDTYPWTEFDMRSTMDSLKIAIQWLEEQAKERGIPLNIISDYYVGEEYSTIKKGLPFGSVVNSITEPRFKKGLEALNDWADNLAKKAGVSFDMVDKDGVPEIKNPRNKERLIAYLRDEKQVESVALLYLMNNYFKNDISIPVNHLGTDDVEFAIVSYKYPSIITQNILYLFGAADLSSSPYRKNEKKIKMAQEYFPNDIMQDVYAKSIYSCTIGEFTAYLIGWEKSLDSKYKSLLTDNIMNF